MTVIFPLEPESTCDLVVVGRTFRANESNRRLAAMLLFRASERLRAAGTPDPRVEVLLGKPGRRWSRGALPAEPRGTWPLESVCSGTAPLAWSGGLIDNRLGECPQVSADEASDRRNAPLGGRISEATHSSSGLSIKDSRGASGRFCSSGISRRARPARHSPVTIAALPRVVTRSPLPTGSARPALSRAGQAAGCRAVCI